MAEQIPERREVTPIEELNPDALLDEWMQSLREAERQAVIDSHRRIGETVLLAT